MRRRRVRARPGLAGVLRAGRMMPGQAVPAAERPRAQPGVRPRAARRTPPVPHLRAQAVPRDLPPGTGRNQHARAAVPPRPAHKTHPTQRAEPPPLPPAVRPRATPTAPRAAAPPQAVPPAAIGRRRRGRVVEEGVRLRKVRAGPEDPATGRRLRLPGAVDVRRRAVPGLRGKGLLAVVARGVPRRGRPAGVLRVGRLAASRAGLRPAGGRLLVARGVPRRRRPAGVRRLVKWLVEGLLRGRLVEQGRRGRLWGGWMLRRCGGLGRMCWRGSSVRAGWRGWCSWKASRWRRSRATC